MPHERTVDLCVADDGSVAVKPTVRLAKNKDMNDKDIPLANGRVLYQTLLTDEEYTVSKTTVRAGGETQWHFHTHVRDRFIVVQGILTVETKVGALIRRIQVSDHHAVEPGVVHHVRNETADDVIYIMIQSGGARDIVLTETESTA